MGKNSKTDAALQPESEVGKAVEEANQQRADAGLAGEASPSDVEITAGLVDGADQAKVPNDYVLMLENTNMKSQINSLAEMIVDLDFRGDEDEGACGIAALRLIEYRALLDAKPEETEAQAPTGNFEVEFAEAQRRFNDIAQSMIPLGNYLRAEGHLDADQIVIFTVAEIADSAMQALQEAKAQNAQMLAQIEALTPDPSQVKPKRTKPISVASKVEDEEFEHASVVVFGDVDGNQITDLASLSFSSDKFAGSASGRTLNADIEFPVHGPARTVAAAFLVDAKGKAVSICELVSPLSVSGGGSARINSGSLLFRAPEKPKADAKADAKAA